MLREVLLLMESNDTPAFRANAKARVCYEGSGLSDCRAERLSAMPFDFPSEPEFGFAGVLTPFRASLSPLVDGVSGKLLTAVRGYSTPPPAGWLAAIHRESL